MDNLLLVTEQNDEQVVSGRALHQFLGIGTEYMKWLARMREYGFAEGTDFNSVKNDEVRLEGNREVKREITDHILKLDMAKELCMLARNEKGKQARHYFLEVEREWNSPEKVMARALRIAERKLGGLTEQVKVLTADTERMRPKEVFADAVTASSKTILIGELAKILRQNGYKIGQNRLFEWMRENCYLIKRKGSDYNCPTQRAMEMGLFEIKETAITHASGDVNVKRTVKVTGKGQVHFINKFMGGATA